MHMNVSRLTNIMQQLIKIVVLKKGAINTIYFSREFFHLYRHHQMLLYSVLFTIYIILKIALIYSNYTRT